MKKSQKTSSQKIPKTILGIEVRDPKKYSEKMTDNRFIRIMSKKDFAKTPGVFPDPYFETHPQ